MTPTDSFAIPKDSSAWARTIDHTLLRPDATAEQVETLVREAWDWGFWSVCLYPAWLSFARSLLVKFWNEHQGAHAPLHQTGLSVHLPQLCAVVGFPSGAQTSKIKVEETLDAVKAGAQEIDWVFPLGYYLSGDKMLHQQVKNQLKQVISAAQFEGALSKVILETSYLSVDQIREVSSWCADAGADFVKTSTGFGSRGASLEDIQIMHETLRGRKVKIKASGGIRDFKTANLMLEAGAHRIGSSASVKIMKEILGQ